MKNLFSYVLFYLIIGLFAYLDITPVLQAFTMSNSQFIIELGNFNSIAGSISGNGKKLTFTSGETGAGLYTGTNYKLCAGFYGGIFCNKISTTSAAPIFTFTISPTIIDFGTIDPTNPLTRNNTLTVSSNQPFGYSVTALEDHSLKFNSNTIPDTTCDNGQCNPTTASIWNNTLTFGFGYRCDDVIGTDCVTDFSSANSYKPFPNQQLGQTEKNVMAGTVTSSGKTGQITYKVNVSGSQLPGTYTNTITYVAIPTF